MAGREDQNSNGISIRMKADFFPLERELPQDLREIDFNISGSLMLKSIAAYMTPFSV